MDRPLDDENRDSKWVSRWSPNPGTNHDLSSRDSRLLYRSYHVLLQAGLRGNFCRCFMWETFQIIRSSIIYSEKYVYLREYRSHACLTPNLIPNLKSSTTDGLTWSNRHCFIILRSTGTTRSRKSTVEILHVPLYVQRARKNVVICYQMLHMFCGQERFLQTRIAQVCSELVA
jgi:hypothetical protein